MIKPYYHIFLNTLYKVYPDSSSQESIVIKIGQPQPELDQLIAPDTSWAFITAWNPLPVVLGEDENRQRNKELKARIQEMGYKCFDAVGITRDESWHEDSYLISGITLEKSMELAKAFGQIAFLFGESGQPARLIYTSEG